MLRCVEPIQSIRSQTLPFDESNVHAPPAFGPYRVLHQIGSGVLGPVFRTYEPQRDRLVAVKAFRLDLLPEDVARLADALRRLVASQITHPNLVPLVDAGLEGTTAYLAMEYVAGETLDVALRHIAPAPLDRALPMIARVAEAVDAAWAGGVGHGALHVRDVFLSPGSADVLVSGAGIVSALDSIGVKAPVRRPYAAPERVAGAPCDLRSDVYALGAIAHEILTRRRPAGPGEQDGALDTLAPEKRVQVRRVLAAALAEDPAHRFPTATAFVQALLAIERGEDVSALVPEAPSALQAPLPRDDDNGRSARPLFAGLDRPEPAPEPDLIAPSAAGSTLIAPAFTDFNAPVDATQAMVSPAPDWSPEPSSPQGDATLVFARDDGVQDVARPAGVDAVDDEADEEMPSQLGGRAGESAGVEDDDDDRDGYRDDDRDLRDLRDDRFEEPAELVTSDSPGLEPTSSYRPESMPLATSGAMFGASAAASPSAARASFPWSAIAAVAVAGLAVGSLVGYQFGFRRGAESSAPSNGPVAASAGLTAGGPASPPSVGAAGDTDVPVRTPADPPAPPAPPAQADPPPPVASPRPVRGELEVRTVPTGAIITVDGANEGTSPQRIGGLALGRHTVRVSKPGYRTTTETVVLSSGTPVRDITIRMPRAATPAASNTGPAPSVGFVSFNTRPSGARVWLNGREVGQTPIARLRTTPGTHSVRVELTGYRPITTTVTVRPGETMPVNLSLERGGG
jgi:serine/threonine protein kinase